MSRVLVDANILMEILFQRSKMKRVSKLLRDPAHEYFISTLTVHILYYFAERDKNISWDFVAELIGICGQLPVSLSAVGLAQQRYDGRDFEDCLQAAVAELGGCREILTLDTHFKECSNTKLVVRIV